MKMKTYNSFEDIEYDLKRLELKREIALEEMKVLKYQVHEELSPYNWIKTASKILGKIGTVLIVKKIFR